MQLLRKMRLSPPGERLTSWRTRSGGRGISMIGFRSVHRWLISGKRNIARFVPRMQNPEEAPRVVITPAVAVDGSPYTVDWVVGTRVALRSTPSCSAVA